MSTSLFCSRSIRFLIFVVVTLVTPVIFRGDIIYRIVSNSDFNSANWELIGGTITTDGTIGELIATNIIDWSIDYKSNERTFNLNPGNSVRGFISGTNVAQGFMASATEIFMTGTPDAAGVNEQFVFLEPTPSFDYGVMFTSSEPSSVGGITLLDSGSNPFRADHIISGGNSFVIGVAIPEPASGLLICVGMLTILARRRRCRPSA